MTTHAGRAAFGAGALALARCAHLGPALAVTTITALLAADAGLDPGTAALATASVLAGQLTIGWGNDLVDADRDRRVGRRDKPLAAGQVSTRAVRAALATAAGCCVALSAALGWRAAAVNLVLHVGSGHAYNLGLKATAWSWAPYAVAFGSLPAVLTLAGALPAWPPVWMMLAGAALGVGAHLLNALPDRDEDLATGVRGLPQRLGPLATRAGATAVLLLASLAALLGPAGPSPAWAWPALALTAGLAVVVLAGRGKAPFRAAVAIALLDVVLLTAGG